MRQAGRRVEHRPQTLGQFQVDDLGQIAEGGRFVGLGGGQDQTKGQFAKVDADFR